ncbi:MAG: HAMP domain-containing histidine kinase [Acidobacteria bacterium]|nr:HAMP domain-containing histidine kinase [Acidobacteriota bacterium]
MTRSPAFLRSLLRICLVGVALALVAEGGGLALARARVGTTDELAVDRVRAELRRRFDEATAALDARVTRVKASPEPLNQATRDTTRPRALFQMLATLLPDKASTAAGLTLYNPRGTPLAWAGRVSDLLRDRVEGPASLFVSLDPLGPRLVRTEPLPDRSRPGARIGTIVAEQLVAARTDVSASASEAFRVSTSVVDVDLQVGPAAGTSTGEYLVPISGPGGTILATATVSARDLAAARRAWHDRTRATVALVLALTVLFLCGPLLELRRHTRSARVFIGSTAAVLLVLLAGRALLLSALTSLGGRSVTTPPWLLPNALLLAAVVWLALDTMDRRRVSSPRIRLILREGTGTALTIAGYVLVGALAAGLLWAYEGVLARIASGTAQDLLRFSLHPFEPARLGTVAGLVLMNASAVWGVAGVLRAPSLLWRTTRHKGTRLLTVGSALIGALLVVAWLSSDRASAVPGGPLLLALGAAGFAAALLARPRGATRRASQAARLGTFFLGLALPALAFYPSLNAFSVAARERLVASDLAPLVASQREDLQSRRLPQALDAIDAMPALADFVTRSSEVAAPTTDRAFIVWSQTELARSRTTSAIELYGSGGRLVSRFALDLPEYTAPEYRGGSCRDWEVYEEVSPFGSTLRNVLRASRALCVGGRRVGGIVVRAQLDYRTLPFVSSPNPYLESLMPRGIEPETTFGHDVELAFYGWSRAPLYASGTRVWPLDDDIFERMSRSRDPQWQRVVRDGQAFRVYFFNDRGGIYALGYPVLTWFNHLINLGELVFFAGVLYALLLVGASVFNALTAQTPASGRALLREIRSSFYRKLFIAFVAAAIIPVVVLALAASTYLANQFRAGVEESAVKTATVAQRLIEDYVALQQRGAGSLDLIDDEFMLLVRRAIDQDVNLFDGPRLRATSERPLFASRLLPSRTPADVYRAIALDKLPTTVVVEGLGSSPSYLVAAAPVRAGVREGIVTVPQTLRQREIEQQIDELDRRVLSAAVLFVLLGSALGYWMAERIADPVNRLTRATRRIARGDLDARIAATSSDELRRLVEDFNRMAADLKTQRANLERTQRLEAWADMARQVAHDIKNPLTPIQLSAEHARRVNIDRGRPLSPVLDECVSSILSQVTLLRQISSEFSSFASSPTARPESTDLAALFDEVVEPYRTGLAGRVSIDVQVQPALPRVFIDRTLFGRALTNVIENALHAMPGGGELTIAAFAGEVQHDGAGAPPCVAVEVTDTGVGMDAEALARIFEPYFSTKATGTGLGLTIARRNVELIGGTIAVRSERGVGTTVTMHLPTAE